MIPRYRDYAQVAGATWPQAGQGPFMRCPFVLDTTTACRKQIRSCPAARAWPTREALGAHGAVLRQGGAPAQEQRGLHWAEAHLQAILVPAVSPIRQDRPCPGPALQPSAPKTLPGCPERYLPSHLSSHRFSLVGTCCSETSPQYCHRQGTGWTPSRQMGGLG